MNASAVSVVWTVSRGVCLGLLIASGCATRTPAAAPAPAASTWYKPAVATRPAPRGCTGQTRYTEGDLAKIVHLRDEGESLKRVAAEVGGSRQEVKCAEHALHQARHPNVMNARYVQRQ
jgi:hypothetical protein